ncbi:penicillin acylase family protein [Haladaptatus halobius]|uniref:penicillin acylase family protein n=1 Tax=Haladaptatus halobius TaxID=2884875 RepID=UPI001D0B83C6|nr:penicillin acylase family protein [Haladaptatus halobius]
MADDLPGGRRIGGYPAGGNSDDYFSEHYRDQLRAWANTEYKPMTREIRGNVAVTFEGENR